MAVGSWAFPALGCWISASSALHPVISGFYTGVMADEHARDPREELLRHLEAGEVTPAAADLALSTLDPEGDRAALRAAEQPGTLSATESARVVDAWDLDEEIAAMTRRLGLEAPAQ